MLVLCAYLQVSRNIRQLGGLEIESWPAGLKVLVSNLGGEPKNFQKLTFISRNGHDINLYVFILIRVVYLNLVNTK